MILQRKKGSLELKWRKMRAVRIDSNAPFDMLFKHKLDVS